MTVKPTPIDLEVSGAADFVQRLHDTLDEIDVDRVTRVVDAFVDTHQQAGTVYLMGNGGSSATAAHFASDLHAAGRGSRRLRVTNLCDNMPVLTATANDHGWANVFADQLTGNLEKRDLVVALSVSGDSENVLGGLDVARNSGARSVALLGSGGGAAIHRAELSLVVSSRDFGIVESVHAALAHLLAASFRRRVGI